MPGRTEFDQLWEHLAPLSDDEIDAIHAAASSDRKYQACLYAVLLTCIALVSGIGVVLHKLYLSVHPHLALKVGALALLFACMWIGYRLCVRLNIWLYDRATMRQIRLRKRAFD